jgi:hypothetical protein
LDSKPEDKGFCTGWQTTSIPWLQSAVNWRINR